MQNYEDLFGMGSVVDPYPLLDGTPVSAKDALKDVGYYVDADVSNKMGVGTAIGLALEAASIGANLWMNYLNNRRNDERAEEAYQRSVAMWNKQTDYNSPANQIARLKQAGLNPNLLYGSPQNTASSAPEKKPASGSSGRIDPLQAMNALMLGKQIQSIDSQIKVQDAEARNIDANTDLVEDKQSTEQEFTRFVKAQADEKEKIVLNFQEEFDKRMEKLDETINLLKKQSETEQQEYRKLFNENNWFAQTWRDRRDIIKNQLKQSGLLNDEISANIDYMFSLTTGNRFANRLQQMLFESSNNFALNGQRMSYYDLYVYSMGKNLFRQEKISQDAFGRYENYEKKTLENRAWFDSTGYGTFLYGAGQTLDAFNVSFNLSPFGMNPFSQPSKVTGFLRR